MKCNHQKAIDLCMKINSVTKNIPGVFEIIASCYWRQKKFQEQIKYATKAVEIDNQFYRAYNTLANGYAGLTNYTMAIKNYEICIDTELEKFEYYSNRGTCHFALSRDLKIPTNIRKQYEKKAIWDCKKVIDLTTSIENLDSSYNLYFLRGKAHLDLREFYKARIDLEKALVAFDDAPKSEQDQNEKKDIKAHLADINDQRKMR